MLAEAVVEKDGWRYPKASIHQHHKMRSHRQYEPWLRCTLPFMRCRTLYGDVNPMLLLMYRSSVVMADLASNRGFPATR